MTMRKISNLFDLYAKARTLKGINTAIRHAVGVSNYFKTEHEMQKAIDDGDLIFYADKIELWWNGKPCY